MKSNAQDLVELIEIDARIEDLKQPWDNRVIRFGTMYQKISLLLGVVGFCGGTVIALTGLSVEAGTILAVFGFVQLLFLPTFRSYRCLFDHQSLKEEYRIICFKKKKEIKWKDVKYVKIKRDKCGEARDIRLLNEKKKYLLMFDRSMVGFGNLAKEIKKRGLPRLKKGM